jgi:integrase
MRWGEVITLRPRHVDFLSRMVSVEDTIVETSKKNSPTGERFLVKPYPKNNEPRTFGVRQGWLDEVAAHIRTKSIGRDELLFATRVGTPISRNSFRTQVWLPAVKASAVDFRVRVHDLRHAAVFQGAIVPLDPQRSSDLQRVDGSDQRQDHRHGLDSRRRLSDRAAGSDRGC